MKNLLENAPKHFVGPPFSARGVLVRPDDRGIHDRAELIFIHLQAESLEDDSPAACLGPAVEPVVDGLPVAEPFRQVPPLDACADAPDDRVDEVPVTALGRWPGPHWYQRLEAFPLVLRQFMSVHSER